MAKENTLQISNYLDAKLIQFLDVKTRDDAITALIDLLNEQGKLQDKDAFHQAILEREKIVSTGIGMGVAIPHAKLPNYSDFFIVLGIHHKGIEWQSLDGAPVHLIFMIGGPDNMQTQYLQVLSRLTLVIKDEQRRKEMVKATSTEEIMALFQSF